MKPPTVIAGPWGANGLNVSVSGPEGPPMLRMMLFALLAEEPARLVAVPIAATASTAASATSPRRRTRRDCCGCVVLMDSPFSRVVPAGRRVENRSFARKRCRGVRAAQAERCRLRLLGVG